MNNVTDSGEEKTEQMSIDTPTDELPIAGTPAESPAEGKPTGSGFAPNLVGVALCALWIMSIGMIVAQIIGSHESRPGPGALAVGSHVAGALAGLVCYRLASRNRGLPRLLGLVVIVVVMVLLLWFFWWSPSR